MVVGALALAVGVMVFPEVNDTLSNIGTTWLGLAVAAGYAYFGLDSSGQRGGPAAQAGTGGSAGGPVVPAGTGGSPSGPAAPAGTTEPPSGVG
jgi:hypothetical protein